ncbi:MAG: hypothetical protein LBK00_10485 [Treponema sp.]|jgi:hypothetical protein|nr:hypothetical protein [Treponema sp.]
MNDAILSITRRAAQKPAAPLSVEPFPWNLLCKSVAETFRFTSQESTAFANNRTARLVAAIPFAAGCEEAERTALAHLAVYMTELRGGRLIGDHTPADNASPFTRLRLLSSFKGGNPDIIRHGMSQLALLMLAGYERSREDDLRRSVYNPLNDGAWDAEAMRLTLSKELQACPCAVLDDILPDVYEDQLW